MSCSDLVSVNAAIVGDVAARVAAVAPAAVLVVVTNPLDEMTQHAWRASGLPATRVIGMAGVLDTARFRALTAQAAGLRPAQVEAMALGSHGDEMVIPLSQASAAGRPLIEVLGETAVTALVDRARDSGAEVVGLLKQGSAFMAPGASAARMVLAMAAGRGEVLPAAVLADGSYGIEGVYVGLPCAAGIVVLVEPVAARRDFAAANGALAAEPDSARTLLDEVTEGRGADAVVDAVGGALGLDSALYLVRRGGTVVSVGVHAEDVWSLPATRAFADELSIRFAIGDFMRDAQPLCALLRAGVVDPTVVASDRVSLDEVPAAYRRMARRSTMKALVQP